MTALGNVEACMEADMSMRRLEHTPLRLGIFVGLAFGAVNLLFSWLDPLADDSVAALLRFYGPMFCLWAFASFRAARNHGRWLSGVTTGLLVALATFCVYDLLVQLRINLFLDDLTGRADWQRMMDRFRASGFDSLRLFINLEYLKGAPLKIAVASAIGAFMGIIGGSMGWLAAPGQLRTHWRTHVDHCSFDIPRQGPRAPHSPSEAGASPRSNMGR